MRNLAPALALVLAVGVACGGSPTPRHTTETCPPCFAPSPLEGGSDVWTLEQAACATDCIPGVVNCAVEMHYARDFIVIGVVGYNAFVKNTPEIRLALDNACEGLPMSD